MDIKVLGAIGGIIALIGVFLPWLTVSVMGVELSASGWEAYDLAGEIAPILVLVLAIITIAVAVFTKDMIQKAGVTILGLITLIVGAYYIMYIGDVAAGLSGFAEVSVSAGYGLYAVVIGGIIALVGGLMAYKGK